MMEKISVLQDFRSRLTLTFLSKISRMLINWRVSACLLVQCLDLQEVKTVSLCHNIAYCFIIDGIQPMGFEYDFSITTIGIIDKKVFYGSFGI